MHNIDHLKRLIGAELEALVLEINELKNRVKELEHKQFHLETSRVDKYEYVGQLHQCQKGNGPVITCNTSKLG
jgi:ribosomal protein S1